MRFVSNRSEEAMYCRTEKTMVRVLMEDTPRSLLAQIKPDVYAIGSDYRGQPLPGSPHCQRVIFVERLPGISTTVLVDQPSGNR